MDHGPRAHVFEFERLASVMAGVAEMHFLADYDAIPHGEEKFRTVHFGWTGENKGGELISVYTNARTGGWEISMREGGQAVVIEFRGGNLFECADDGETYVVAQGDAEVPAAFFELVEASRRAGLSSFDHAPSQGALPSASPSSPRL
jgi:hypothetical protein